MSGPQTSLPRWVRWTTAGLVAALPSLLQPTLDPIVLGDSSKARLAGFDLLA